MTTFVYQGQRGTIKELMGHVVCVHEGLPTLDKVNGTGKPIHETIVPGIYLISSINDCQLYAMVGNHWSATVYVGSHGDVDCSFSGINDQCANKASFDKQHGFDCVVTSILAFWYAERMSEMRG